MASWLAAAGAESLTGTVVSVADGNTLVVFSEGVAHRVRLVGVNAPRDGQPYADASRQNLAQIARGRAASIECQKVDRDQRKVCKVRVQPVSCPGCGHTLDVGLAQIVAGAARWNREDAKEQSDEDRGRYESEETEARLRRRGFWKMGT